MRRGFRDRDFIETPEHFLFCVIGSVHPPDRVISYIKYVPSESGLWHKGERKFQRILRRYAMVDLINTLNFLEHYPEYLYYSPILGIRIPAVPMEKILSHFKPEEKIVDLSRKIEEIDPLERKALDLAIKISEESCVPLRYFGITGSILLGIHQPFSDIDLTVYGLKNARAVKESLKQIYLDTRADISTLKGAKAEEWCMSKSRLHPLTYEEAKRILDRKWNIGIFRGTYFSIHPVKIEDEVYEKYGDRVFRLEGMARIIARVIDDSEADFMPAKYVVEDVKILEGEHVGDIREVVSYEGLYSGVANAGENIVAYGKLEVVFDKRSGETYHRILIGSQEALGMDYIKPL